MYKNFYNFNVKNLLKIRLHLGHKNSILNTNLSSHIFGTRHQINIYDLDKLWKPYKYLFHSLIKNFARRNSFFIVGTNKALPMSSILETYLNQYPFKTETESSFYISGYVDKKWIGGLFTNWKIFREFIQFLEKPHQKFKKRYRFQKYFYFLKGIKNLFKMPIPDFVILLNNDKEALYELKHFQVPLIGLVDTDMNPKEFIYNFLGNNDSIENIEFFFNFLQETINQGRFLEQQQYYNLFIYKIKKNLKNN